MSVAMLIVGTMIGAGFASGKEVVTFFGAKPNMFSALITGVLVFGCSVLFLFVGRRVKCSEIGEVNGVVFGRARVVADILMLFNSITVLGAMLAATDTLVAEFMDIRPFASIVIGLCCAFIAVRGLNGLIKANAVLVPMMIVFLCVCSLCSMNFPFRPQSSPIMPHFLILYVAMNMILGGSVLTTVHNLSPREIILSSAVAAIIVSALLTLIMGALQSCSASHADMPMLVIALKSGKPMYFVCLPIIGASVFTTMLSAFKSLYDYLNGFIPSRFFAAGLVLCGGLAVGALSFGTVVSGMYPIMGGVGILYILCAAWFLIRTRVKRRIKKDVGKVKRRIKRRAFVKKNYAP